MKHHLKKAVGSLLVPAILLALLAAQVPAQAAASELFFSEYIEGSSYNKALEIYNGTGTAVDLAAGGYSVQMSFNGGTSTQTIDLSGSIADGDVYIIAPTNATDATILAEADQLQGTSWFNGDDTVLLLKDEVIIDAIGQVGFDPGSEWGSDLTSTQDNTLRRKTAISAGDTDATDAFDPSVEWDGFDNNTFDGLGSHTAGPVVADPRINEFVFNHTDTDTNEYVEVLGTPDTDYSAYTILQIEGDDTGPGMVDSVLPVGVTDASGYWLSGYLSNVFENGTVTLLLVEGFTGSQGTDLDADDDGNLDGAPWSMIVDSVAVSDGGTTDLTYAAATLAPGFDGQAYGPGGASRIPDGSSTWVRNDFDGAGLPGFGGSIAAGEAYNTPGAANEVYVPPAEMCGDPFTPVYAIQGSGPASPLDGSQITTEGIVTADLQGSDQKSGFFLQDATGDGDAATSDGIFVYTTSVDVNTGDAVRVRGTVDEYYDLTEITSVELTMICATGSSVPATPLSLPVTSLDDFEPYESMLVTFPQPLAISEYYNFDRYGEIVLSTGRQYQPTSLFEPGSPEVAQLTQDNLLGLITLDDGRSVQNPDPAYHPNGGIFDLSNLFRGGDVLENVTGVLDYSYDLWRIHPTQGADYLPANPRTAQPADVGGSLRVASFNVLNYFTTLGSRGADTPEEFTRQQAKIIAALQAIDADVVGLIEIENNTEAIQNLVDALNAAVGAGTYAYVDTGVIGTDEIKVAFIYKPASVSLVGSYAILDSSVDSRFIDTKNRPALAQTFQDNATGGVFTAVVNHLKSKGSDCADIGDPDLGDGAGNCNLTRTTAVEAMIDWLATDPTGSGDDDFLVIGDMNAYAKEDPIDAFKAGGYTDLVALYQGELAYSYVFDGQLGYLDHALASPGLLDEVTGTADWHINADEADLIDYDMTYKQDAQDAIYSPDAYRASDHDPVVIGLDVCDEIAPTLSISAEPQWLWPVNHKYVKVKAKAEAADNIDPEPTITLLSVTSSEPDSGLGPWDRPKDIVIVDDFTFRLRAERALHGPGRVYTITYQVTDACGNTATASVEVRVPRHHWVYPWWHNCEENYRDLR
ncbi:MAG: ExeM/NucH family extracellular endonuclease [Anaerolineae bacterium]|nr:ExeM/NucH family extracellular endonuclease [Anaerolineae bacterium]